MKIRLSLLALLSLFLSSCVINGKNSSSLNIDGTGVSASSSNFGSESKRILLTYSGSAANKEFTNSLIEKFKEERKNIGDNNIYDILYLEREPNQVTFFGGNWKSGPDIYEFTTDRFSELYKLGVLSKITGTNANFINENYGNYGKNLATFNGDYYAYPYTGDSTYYIHYNKSFFTSDDVKSIETMLNKAQLAGKKIGFPLNDSYYGGAILYSFGASCNTNYDNDGNIVSINANFNTDKGLKGAKAIQTIASHPALVNAGVYPLSDDDSDIVAVISGHWNSSYYKNKFYSNYACAVMPTITIDGDTKHLSAFLDGLAFGINPKSLEGDIDRITAAHDLAKFLSNEESQLARFENQSLPPCNINAITNEKISSNPNVKTIISQYDFAITQNNIPKSFWQESGNLLYLILEGSIKTEDDLVENVNLLNDNIIKNTEIM
ncbi:MAG: extracellular solute-binding protein [Erysipelotrichales bacterium]|nr:extracellular solute-binding protein [Erysipelotrichales bacterium]